MFSVKSVKETFDIIREAFGDFHPGTETVGIEDALDRVLAEDLYAREDIPAFNRSSVDGYAVLAKDTFGASEAMPAQLLIAGEVRMGDKPDFEISQGQSAYIPTGGELPKGADSVVMVEYTENFNDGDIFINKPAAPGNSVVYRGDDVREGAAVLLSGQRLRSQDIGMVAGLGYQQVSVYRKVRIGIISTGDEVVGIGENPVGAQVRDINSYAVYASAKKMGMEPVMFGIVKDSFEAIQDTVKRAMEACDIVTISGGSSVGTKDVTVNVIESLGKPGVLVHGIAVKPGKPTILGKVGTKAVVGLPGHPASAFVIFNIFVRKLLEAMEKKRDIAVPSVRAEMGINYPSNQGREEYLPVVLEEKGGKLYANPVFGKSGMISTLTKSDGYIHIRRGSEGVDKGQSVEVMIF